MSILKGRNSASNVKPTVVSYPPSEDGTDSFLKPLSAAFYSNLLRLEEKIQNRDFSEATINEIILLYAKCVEYYDCMKDPIKNYFLEKMQNTLVSREALAILVKGKGNSPRIETVELESRVTLEEEEQKRPSLAKNYPSELMEKVGKMERYKHLKKSISSRYSYTKKKLERIKKMNLFLEWQEQKDVEQLTIASILTSYEGLSRENDDLVAADLSSQLENLQNRLEKRRLFNNLKKNQFDPSFLSTSLYSKEFSDDLKPITKLSMNINSPQESYESIQELDRPDNPLSCYTKS